MSVVLLAALIAVICTALYLRHKKRELAALENLKNLANGEYLNWAKAERGFSEEQGTYPAAAEYSPEYFIPDVDYEYRSHRMV